MIGFALVAVFLACAGASGPGAPRCGVDVELADWRPGDVVSPDLRHLLQVRRRRGALTVLLDGEVLREGADEVGPMGFLADGTPHVTWRRGARWWRQVGARASDPHDQVGPLVTDGAHGAFAARRGARWRAVVDGRASASWEAIGAVRVSGGHAAWSARQDDRWLALVDGRAVGAADAVHLIDLDGASLLWAARHDEALVPRIGRRVLPGRWRAVGPGRLRGEAWRLFVADERGWWVLRHDAIEGPLDGEPLGFTRDGRPILRESEAGAVRVRVGARAGPWSHAVALLEAGQAEPTVLARGPSGWTVHVGGWSSPPRGRPVAVAVAGDLVALAYADRGGEVVLHRVGDPDPLLSEPARVLDVDGPTLAIGPGDLRFLHLRGDRAYRREIPFRCLPRRDPPGPAARPDGQLFGGVGGSAGPP